MLDGILHDDRVVQVVTRGALGGVVWRANPGASPPDPRDWWKAIEAVRNFVPSGIVVGTTAEFFTLASRISRAALLIEMMTKESERVGASADTTGALRDALAAQLNALQMPSTTIWVQMRADSGAMAGMMLATTLIGHLKKAASTFTADRDVVGAHVRVADAFSPRERLALAVEAGLVPPDVEPDQEALIEAMGALDFEIWVERMGNDLRITLGSRPEPTRRTRFGHAQLGRLYHPEALGYVAWDGTRLDAVSTDWAAFWGRHDETPALLAVEADDTEFFVSDLRRWFSDFGGLATHGSMRILIDDALTVEARVVGAPKARELDDFAAVRLVPARTDWLALDARETIGNTLIGAIEHAEDRLARRSFTDLGAKEAERRWYEAFGGLRTVIVEESPTVFLSPVSVLGRMGGRIDRIVLRGGPDDRSGDLVISDLPSPSLALAGTVTSREAGRRFADRVVRALLEGVRRGAPMPHSPGRLAPVDHGLGVPTWRFDGEFLGPLTGGKVTDIEIDGDFAPHLFFLDADTGADAAVVVLSTSPDLSRDIVATANDGAARFEARRAARAIGNQQPGRLVAYAQVGGSWFAHVVELIAAPLEAIAAEHGMSPGERPAFIGVLRSLGQLAALIHKVRWQVFETDEARSVHIRVVPAARPPALPPARPPQPRPPTPKLGGREMTRR